MNTTILNTTSTGETAIGERGRPAARVAVAAILSYWALSIAVAIANPHWNPLTRQLSEYALGNHGWLQVAAFLAQAVAYGALAVAVRALAGRIGLVILSYCALGSIGVGVFVTDPMTTPPDAMTTHGVLHTAFGGSALILLPAAALLITRSIAGTPPRTQTAASCAAWPTCPWPDLPSSGFPRPSGSSRLVDGPTGSCS